MIKLQDILQFNDEESERVRVRFTMPNGIEDPKKLYIHNKDIINYKWFLHSGKKYNNFKPDTIAVSLLLIEKDTWLLTAVKRIISATPPNEGKIWDFRCYKTEDISKYDEFCGRTYIHFHKRTQSGKYKWKTVCDHLVISRIDSETYGDCTFTGYKFELSFPQLEYIILENKRDWINALSHIQAVYLITDNLTGKFYVGSATSSDEFLLSRWKTYVKNGHGGNVKLKELVDEKGFEYVKNNFSYRILDYFSENYPASKVLESECYWKDVLKTRKFGYNAN